MPAQKNSKKYLPPKGYYDRTFDRPLSSFLKLALRLHKNPREMTALDFGCGAGNQSKFMLEKGYRVVAVDGNKEAVKYIAKLPHQDRLSFVHSDFENFEFKKYDLINSLHALSFTNKKDFNRVMKNLKSSIKPGGIFAGQFYGDRDEWNKPGETMTFLTRDDATWLFSDMEIVSFEEKDEQGTIANNTPKHWHVYEIVAKKPAKST